VIALAIALGTSALAPLLGTAGITEATAEADRAGRVQERNVVCTTQAISGVHKFTVSFAPWQPPSSSSGAKAVPAHASISSGTSYYRGPDVGLVGVSAGPVYRR
jgi:hypothetical protein